MTRVRLCGYQPQYFPRLHYFARILDADIFKIADSVQFVQRHIYTAPDGSRGQRGPSYQAHTLIKTASGIHELGVPVFHQGPAPIHQTGMDYHDDWNHTHAKTIGFSYARSRNAASLLPQLTEILDQQYKTLAELTTSTILWGLAWVLGQGELRPQTMTLETINQLLSEPHPFRLKKIIVASRASIPSSDAYPDATDWIIDWCRAVGANEYYHGGTAATAYLDFSRFERANIRTVHQNWVCTPYTQLFSSVGFLPNLSIIDLLANEEHPRVVQILKGA